MKGHVYAGDGGVVLFNVDIGDPGVGEDGEIGTLILAAEDRVDVCHAGAASATIVWVVGDGEEADSLFQFAVGTDLLVKVLDDGNVHCRRARLNPVLAELVSVTGVDRLNGVAEGVEHAGEGVKGPAAAAH